MEPVELEIDPVTGMKNYIANENLGIATSAGYIKFSFNRSIHYGRVYTNGASGTKGKEADLCEALRYGFFFPKKLSAIDAFPGAKDQFLEQKLFNNSTSAQ